MPLNPLEYWYWLTCTCKVTLYRISVGVASK